MVKSSAEQWHVGKFTRQGRWPVLDALGDVVCSGCTDSDAGRIVKDHNSRAPDAETLRGLLPASVYAYFTGHLMWLEQNMPQSGAIAMFKDFMTAHEEANRAALARSAVQEEA